jgi:hypothetical protein
MCTRVRAANLDRQEVLASNHSSCLLLTAFVLIVPTHSNDIDLENKPLRLRVLVKFWASFRLGSFWFFLWLGNDSVALHSCFLPRTLPITLANTKQNFLLRPKDNICGVESMQHQRMAGMPMIMVKLGQFVHTCNELGH